MQCVKLSLNKKTNQTSLSLPTACLHSSVYNCRQLSLLEVREKHKFPRKIPLDQKIRHIMGIQMNHTVVFNTHFSKFETTVH